MSAFLWCSVQLNISLLSVLTSLIACSSGIVLYVEVSIRCFIPHSMYCFVLMPTGPRFLSAGAMVISEFCFIVEDGFLERCQVGNWQLCDEGGADGFVELVDFGFNYP